MLPGFDEIGTAFRPTRVIVVRSGGEDLVLNRWRLFLLCDLTPGSSPTRRRERNTSEARRPFKCLLCRDALVPLKKVEYVTLGVAGETPESMVFESEAIVVATEGASLQVRPFHP